MNVSVRIFRVGIALLTLAVGACATVSPKDYSKFRSEAPRSILVLPALNQTVSVTAPEFFHSTVSKPFAERGYYVFPAHMVKRVLEDDGLADAALVHAAPATRMGTLFGCDAALYIAIERWDSQYAVIVTQTTVDLKYQLRSCRTDQVLWEDRRTLAYSPQSSSSGNPLADLIANAVVAALEKAAPNYMPLAQQANLLASSTLGQGLPAGPYRASEFGKDGKTFPSSQ